MPHFSAPPAQRWPLILLLSGVLLLVCVAPSGVLMSSLLLFSPATVAECGSAGPTPATTTTSCGIDPDGNAIVAWALAIASHLYPCPDIFEPGQLPPYMDVCYDEGMPPAVIRYWEATCPGCIQWRNGNLQCVMSVLAAFGLGGAPAPVAGNAISFWWDYAHRPGWVEIPVFFAPGSTSSLAAPSIRGLPRPGDMVVWYISWDPLVGHIAVVVRVRPPRGDEQGSLSVAEANGPTPLYTMSINPDLTVNAWPGYFVAGYVRHVGAGGTSPDEKKVRSP
jgi:hypothetical protein